MILEGSKCENYSHHKELRALFRKYLGLRMRILVHGSRKLAWHEVLVVRCYLARMVVQEMGGALSAWRLIATDAITGKTLRINLSRIVMTDKDEE